MAINIPHNHTQFYFDAVTQDHADDPAFVQQMQSFRAAEATYWGDQSNLIEANAARLVTTMAAAPTGLQSAHDDPSPSVPLTVPASSNADLFGVASPSAPYALHDEGPTLANNKSAVLAALQALGASPSDEALIMAMGMQETTQMDPSQRDTSKDGSASENVSAFNLNADMVRQLGYQGDLEALNDPANIAQVVGLLLTGVHTWGVQRLLDFQRGGSTAFADGQSYGAADYRNAIGTSYNLIMADPSLLSDSRRVAIDVQHV